ncbi:MAG: hypothetical protein ACTSPS_02525 [Promethearchaeota archaeon]|jgi:hypothetical protein
MDEFSILLLLFINFGLFFLALLFIVKEILKANKKNNKNSETNDKKGSSFGRNSYALALLAMVTMIFISFLLLGF